MIAVVDEMYIKSEVEISSSDKAFFSGVQRVILIKNMCTSDVHRCKGGGMSFEISSHRRLSFEIYFGHTQHRALYAVSAPECQHSVHHRCAETRPCRVSRGPLGSGDCSLCNSCLRRMISLYRERDAASGAGDKERRRRDCAASTRCSVSCALRSVQDIASHHASHQRLFSRAA